MRLTCLTALIVFSGSLACSGSAQVAGPAPAAQAGGAGQESTIWRVFPGLDLTNDFAATTLHARALWAHPDYDGDGVEDLLSTAGGGDGPPDPRKGAFDLISSSTGEILAGGEFGSGIVWEFFLHEGSQAGKPLLVSYSMELKHATHLFVHRWNIQEGPAGATFVPTLCAEVPLPEEVVGDLSGYFLPRVLRTQSASLTYLACVVDYKRYLLQLGGDPLVPSISMAWPRTDRPWLPEAQPEVEYHWAVLPDLDSDGFDELAVGPSGAPLPRSEQPLPKGVAPQPEPQASLLVLSGKDFHVLRVVDLPGFGRRDLVALTAGRHVAPAAAGVTRPREGPPATTPEYTLFAYCSRISAEPGRGTLLRIDPRSGQVDAELSARGLRPLGSSGQWPLSGALGINRNESILWVDSPRPLLVFGNTGLGCVVCIDPNSAEMLWTAVGKTWGGGAIGDHNFGASSCWLRAASGMGLIAIGSPYLRSGQASISFFRLQDGHPTVRIDCAGE
jgi:hypothetical protein